MELVGVEELGVEEQVAGEVLVDARPARRPQRHRRDRDQRPGAAAPRVHSTSSRSTNRTANGTRKKPMFSIAFGDVLGVGGLDRVEDQGGGEEPAQARAARGRRSSLAARRSGSAAEDARDQRRRRSPGRAGRAGSPSRRRSRPGPAAAGRRTPRSRSTSGRRRNDRGERGERRRRRPPAPRRPAPGCGGSRPPAARPRRRRARAPARRSARRPSRRARSGGPSSTSAAAAAPQATRIPISSSAEAVTGVAPALAASRRR